MGAMSQPPDFIIRGGDAVEVKKTSSFTTRIELNSSYPKSKLHADSRFINSSCRDCEEWKIKDHLYAFGVVNNNQLNRLWLIYGDCFAANRKYYEDIFLKLSENINQIHGFEFEITNELGRLNNIDPLRITNLRIRGMWEIQNPSTIFDYVVDDLPRDSLQVIAIMKKDKYDSFPETDKINIRNLLNARLTMNEIQLRDPNNPANRINAINIHYSNHV